MNKFLTVLISIILISLTSEVIAREFVHPGVFVTRSDLDRMKYAVKNKMEPWYSSYQNLMADTKSSFKYATQGDPSWTEVKKTIPNAVHKHEYEADIQAAYQNALMWYITEDTRHAEKAIEIIETWSNLKHTSGIPLSAGLYGAPIIRAAEIIRHTYDGWSEESIKKFEDMLVYPGYSATDAAYGAEGTSSSGKADVSFYWKTYYGDPARAGNQDASCWQTQMAMGIFLDNEKIYDRGFNYLTSQPTRDDDLPNAPGPTPSGPKIEESSTIYKTAFEYGTQLNQIKDYGYNGAIEHYIYENGQCQESSRDQTHTVLGIGLLTNAAEIAWSQGDDMYGFLDNRILLGYEFSLKYILSYNKAFDDQPTPWEPTVENGLYMEKLDRTGRNLAHKINPYVDQDLSEIQRKDMLFMNVFETPLAHYKTRQSLPSEKYLWLERSRDYVIEETGTYETSGGDGVAFLGWGVLTSRRIAHCPGDPVRDFKNGVTPDFSLPELPGLVSAENFDYFPVNAGGGNGKTYFNTETNKTNSYRPEEDVNIEYSDQDEGYYISGVSTGDWYNYTISLPETGDYDIYLHYQANSSSKLKLEFNEEMGTGDIVLSETTYGESETWQTVQITNGLTLEGLVQAMRLHIVEGESSLKIGDIIVVRNGTPSSTVDYLIENRRKANMAKKDVSVKNILSSNQVKVYPNPTNGIFRVDLNNNIGEITQLDVFNLLGQLIKSGVDVNNLGSFDISDLPNGQYIIKISIGNNLFNTKILKSL
ncbi:MULTISPECIES: T9SS type A sorting domain-containing protein [unclassified Saccharicrinis]|uniref:T9SS type A sorting domain-containing protein n=1 Tax=unclassified Saccharicrinis TaxID=2646859 RepID=UPI003D3292A2